jgi:hypothetical protein
MFAGGLAVIVPLVLLLIVASLYASFGNARQALLVMLNVPFALVGVVAALWVRGLNLNLSASVGLIALFGVAVLNGVVLVSYTNRLRDRGRPLNDAVREGSEAPAPSIGAGFDRGDRGRRLTGSTMAPLPCACPLPLRGQRQEDAHPRPRRPLLEQSVGPIL